MPKKNLANKKLSINERYLIKKDLHQHPLDKTGYFYLSPISLNKFEAMRPKIVTDVNEYGNNRKDLVNEIQDSDKEYKKHRHHSAITAMSHKNHDKKRMRQYNHINHILNHLILLLYYLNYYKDTLSEVKNSMKVQIIIPVKRSNYGEINKHGVLALAMIRHLYTNSKSEDTNLLYWFIFHCPTASLSLQKFTKATLKKENRFKQTIESKK